MSGKFDLDRYIIDNFDGTDKTHQLNGLEFIIDQHMFKYHLAVMSPDEPTDNETYLRRVEHVMRFERERGVFVSYSNGLIQRVDLKAHLAKIRTIKLV